MKQLAALCQIFLLVVVIHPAAPASPGQAGSDAIRKQGTLIRGTGFSGVIFPSDRKAFQFEFTHDVGYWTPTESDVVIAESKLLPFLKNAASKDRRISIILKSIASYKRQYVGIILGGQKQIFINLLCSEAPGDWTRKEIIVVDGGPCFFNVRFSNRTRTFSHLWINGEG